MKFIDLSHTVEHGMITYNGLPGPLISDFLGREESQSHYTHGTKFQIGKIEMVANTGTYLDSPFHRFESGEDLSQLHLSSIANVSGIVVRVSSANQKSIGREVFSGKGLAGKAVLIHTGWSKHWRTDRYFENHPFLTREAVEYLVESRVALVGIDSLNIDDTNDGSRPAHSLLLDAKTPIVEHLCNLEQVPGAGFEFFAVPVKVKGMGSFPVRAFAVVR